MQIIPQRRQRILKAHHFRQQAQSLRKIAEQLHHLRDYLAQLFAGRASPAEFARLSAIHRRPAPQRRPRPH